MLLLFNSVNSYSPQTIPLNLPWKKRAKLTRFRDQILPPILLPTITAATMSLYRYTDLLDTIWSGNKLTEGHLGLLGALDCTITALEVTVNVFFPLPIEEILFCMDCEMKKTTRTNGKLVWTIFATCIILCLNSGGGCAWANSVCLKWKTFQHFQLDCTGIHTGTFDCSVSVRKCQRRYWDWRDQLFDRQNLSVCYAYCSCVYQCTCLWEELTKSFLTPCQSDHRLKYGLENNTEQRGLFWVDDISGVFPEDNVSHSELSQKVIGWELGNPTLLYKWNCNLICTVSQEYPWWLQSS